MKVYYNPDTDYAEIFFKTGIENYADDLDENVLLFKSEENDEVIGYAFDFASKLIPASNLLSITQKVGALLVMLRKKQGKTQEEMSSFLNIGHRTLQDIEKGGIKKVEDFEKIIDAFKKITEIKKIAI